MHIIATIICFILAAASFVFCVIAGADPEGRGGNYIMAGLAGVVLFGGAGIILLVLTVWHWLA